MHLRAARDLRSKDRFMGGLVEGKSDPYAVLRVGTQVVTSRVIDNNLNPTWDEVYEVRPPPRPSSSPPPSPRPAGTPVSPPDLVVGGTGTLPVSPAGPWWHEDPNPVGLDMGTPVRSPAWLCWVGGPPVCPPPH